DGAISKSMSFGYTLRPGKSGKLVIDRAQIISGNQRLYSDPIIIEVVQGSEKEISEQEEIFVQATLSDSLAYVGQQIILDYKLYTKLDVRSVNFLSEDDFEGFYHQALQSDRSSLKREIINGSEYYTKSIKKIALFPQQTGTYSIDPVDINLGIASKNSNRGFFFSSQLIPRRVNVDGMTVIVQNSPQDPDIYDSGAVGHYIMTANTAKRSLTTDEAIIVNMQITGNGDSKTVYAPRWNLPPGLEMYDPNTIEDQVFPNNNQITHRKTFEYLIVAKKPGKYSIKPEFSYFSPDSNRYISITRTLPTITVLQGSNEARTIGPSNEDRLEDIFNTTKLRKRKEKPYGSFLHWMFISFLILAGFSIIAYDIYLNKTGKRDPEVIRKNKALKIARERLSKANQFKSDENKKAFYEEIIYVLKKYISDKYDIPALHLNKSEIINDLSLRTIDTSLLNRLKELFNNAEIALYAPVSNLNPDSVYEETLDLISSLES
ncbi:MAG: BatD family protein, partial [Bacteroidia bacterium]|nr:BatD family protein [Bacteroidia bacterium]